MTKKKKIIWWVVGIFFGWPIIATVIMAIAGDFDDGKYPNSFKDDQLVLGGGDTLCIENDTLTLHSPEMTSAKFDLHFKEEMITTLKGEELKPSLNGKNWTPVAFLEYKDSLGAGRILIFGKYHISRDACRVIAVKDCMRDLKHVEKAGREAEIEALTSYDTDKKEDFLAWQQVLSDHEAKLTVDLVDYIDKITLVIGGGKTEKTYDFTPSMGSSYNTLINFIFDENIYQTN